MNDFMYVQSTQSENRMAICETDERHPNGEIAVYGDEVFQVYPTQAVMTAISQKRLREVSSPKLTKAEKAEKTEKTEKAAATENG